MLQTSLLGSLTATAATLQRRIAFAAAYYSSEDRISSLFTYGILIPAVALAGLFFYNLAGTTVLAASLEPAPARIEVSEEQWGNVLFPDNSADELRVTTGKPANVLPGYRASLPNARLETLSGG